MRSTQKSNLINAVFADQKRNLVRCMLRPTFNPGLSLNFVHSLSPLPSSTCEVSAVGETASVYEVSAVGQIASVYEVSAVGQTASVYEVSAVGQTASVYEVSAVGQTAPVYEVSAVGKTDCQPGGPGFNLQPG